MHHRLGRPLPCQLANAPRAHPLVTARKPPFIAWACALTSYLVLAPVSKWYPKLKGRLPTCYSPVRRSRFWLPTEVFRQNCSLDLHVLGTPPAFVLSQDQTLIFLNVCLNVCSFVPRFASRIYLLAKLTSLFCFGFFKPAHFCENIVQFSRYYLLSSLKQLFHFARFICFCQALFSDLFSLPYLTAFIILLNLSLFVNWFCSIYVELVICCNSLKHK